MFWIVEVKATDQRINPVWLHTNDPYSHLCTDLKKGFIIFSVRCKFVDIIKYELTPRFFHILIQGGCLNGFVHSLMLLILFFNVFCTDQREWGASCVFVGSCVGSRVWVLGSGCSAWSSFSLLSISSASEHCVLCEGDWVLLIPMPCCSHRSRLIPALPCLSVATRALSSRWEPSQLLLLPLTLTQGCSQEYKLEVPQRSFYLLDYQSLAITFL